MYIDSWKMIQIITYLLQKEGTMNYVKLLKLIYFADKFHLKEYWDLITWDTYYAMKMWPVASSVYDIIKVPEKFNYNSKKLPFKLKEWSYNLVIVKKIQDFDHLSQIEKESLDLIYERFWNISQRDLINLTHKYNEWKKFENNVNWWWRAEMNIFDFFEDSEWQDPIFNIPKDRVEITKDLYSEKLEYEI